MQVRVLCQPQKTLTEAGATSERPEETGLGSKFTESMSSDGNGGRGFLKIVSWYALTKVNDKVSVDRT